MLRHLARGAPSPIWRRFLTPADPAVGTGVSLAPTAGRFWQILSVAVTFKASADAGNRAITLQQLDGDGKVLGSFPAPAFVTANSSRLFDWHTGLGTTLIGVGAETALPLPAPMYLANGETLVISGQTSGTDAYTNVRGVVIETNAGDSAYREGREQAIVEHAQALYDLTH